MGTKLINTNSFCDFAANFSLNFLKIISKYRKKAIQRMLNLIRHSADSYLQSYGLMIIHWLPCQNKILKDGN